MPAAKRFFEKAMGANGNPDKIAMDKSGANKAAIDEVNAGRDVRIAVRQVKYLNNIVEQECAIKRVTRPMLSFKSFRSASSVLAGIELIHMIRKGQFEIDGAEAMSFADQFSAMAGVVVQCEGRSSVFGQFPPFDQQRDRTFRQSAKSVRQGRCRASSTLRLYPQALARVRTRRTGRRSSARRIANRGRRNRAGLNQVHACFVEYK
jgi:hypothetical protein